MGFWGKYTCSFVIYCQIPPHKDCEFCILTETDESLCFTIALLIKCIVKLLSFCLTDEKLYLSRVLICIVLILSESEEYIFICLRTIFMNYLFAWFSTVLFRSKILNLGSTEENTGRTQEWLWPYLEKNAFYIH